MNPRDANEVDPDTEPPTNQWLRLLAGVLIAIPIAAMVWVGSYSREEPRLVGFPFFIWYQLLWVVLTSVLIWIAYRIILVARPSRPLGQAPAGRGEGDAGTDGRNP